jgi:hypothetical protein
LDDFKLSQLQRPEGVAPRGPRDAALTAAGNECSPVSRCFLVYCRFYSNGNLGLILGEMRWQGTFPVCDMHLRSEHASRYAETA